MDPIILNNMIIPNVCQNVKIGADCQNNGASQFHKHCRTKISPKIKNIIIKNISKHPTSSLIFVLVR